MRATLVLLRYSLRRVRGPMLAVWILFFGLQILISLVATGFEKAGRFQDMANFIPDFIRPFIDPSILTTLSFQGMICFGYLHLVAAITSKVLQAP